MKMTTWLDVCKFLMSEKEQIKAVNFKFIQSNFNLNQNIDQCQFEKYMSLDESLEEVLKKQQPLHETRLYEILITYASQVRDELQVLTYMKHFGIGIMHADFWIRICKIFQKQCYFVQLVKIIIRIKSKQNIENRQKICQLQKTVLQDMRLTIYSQFRGKRSANQFSIQKSPSKRIIGNIQITEGDTERNNDKLKSYAILIEDQMSQFCHQSREQYLRHQNSKPLSFVSTNNTNLLMLTKQIFHRILSTDYVDTSDDESFKLQKSQIRTNINANIKCQQTETQKSKEENKFNNLDKIAIINGELKDNAFIEYSSLNDSIKQKQLDGVSKQDFELGYIIQQIQRQTYEQPLSTKSAASIQYKEKKYPANKNNNQQLSSIDQDAIPLTIDLNETLDQIQDLLDLIQSKQTIESNTSQDNKTNEGRPIQNVFNLANTGKKNKQANNKLAEHKRYQIVQFQASSQNHC